MNLITMLFVYIIELYVAIDFFGSMFSEKTPKPIKWLTGTFFYAAAFVIYELFNNALANIIFFFFINIAFVLLCYKCTIKKAVFSSLLMVALSTSTEFIVMMTSSMMFNDDINAYKSSIAIFSVFSFISKLLYFLTIKIFIMFVPGFKDNKKGNTPLFLFLFPACAVVTFYVLYFISVLYEVNKPLDIAIFILSIIITLAIIFTYIFYGKNQKELNELYKAQAETEKTKIDIAYYSILDRQNEQLKTIIHDEKNHLATIKSLSDNPEINDYIDRIFDEIKVHSLFGNTGNKMLDLVLNKYQYVCENGKIDLNVSVKTANLSYIENTDLITILSNMLDNAVEAARISTEKRIDLSINRANGFDIITCVNSSDRAPQSEGKSLKTTKHENGFHGLGIKSIKKLVSRYQGSFEWSYDESSKEFTVYIAFRT